MMLHGTVEVWFGNNTYSVLLGIRILETYPDKPPRVSIFNIDGAYLLI
jgi:hypothetical protein